MQIDLLEKIGAPAFMEQLAEEASELSQASLKFARKIRGENPTPRDSDEIYKNLAEEIGDVLILIGTLTDKDPEFVQLISNYIMYKQLRINIRFAKEE